MLALQRAAGNRAVAALLREVKTDATTGKTVVKFTVGVEIDRLLAQEAKKAAAGGALDDFALSRLQAIALMSGDSVNDDERMFLAALTYEPNAVHLAKPSRSYSSAGDTVTFNAGTITPARRARVRDFGRPAIPADVVQAREEVSKANERGDYDAALANLAAEDAAAEKAALKMTGSFAPQTRKVLDLAQAANVAATDILRAMIAAASDSTEGDQAYAGAVYLVAVTQRLPVADDLRAGRLKVDQVDASASGLAGGEWAGYHAAGSKLKGDTIYLRDGFNVGSLAHRGAVVHELQHAMDDKAAGTKQLLDRARAELGAYRTQARFLLQNLAPLTGHARQTAAKDAAALWNRLVAIAIEFESRTDPKRFGLILAEVNNLAAPGDQIPSAELSRWRKLTKPQLETQAVSEIENVYDIPATVQPKLLVEGLAGESILDWSGRP